MEYMEGLRDLDATSVNVEFGVRLPTLAATPTPIVTAIGAGSDTLLTLLNIPTGCSNDEATHGKWLVVYTRVWASARFPVSGADWIGPPMENGNRIFDPF